MSVFKAAGRDNALTGFADVGNSVTAAHAVSVKVVAA
jgi:hypothetical protein